MIKNMPDAIIDFPKGMEFGNQIPEIEVIVKKDGKTIYHNKTYAIVMNMVQSITKLEEEADGDVSLEGDSQVFGCGNAIVQLFAMNELVRKLESVQDQAMGELQHYLKDPKAFRKRAKQIMKNTNRT